MSSRGWITVVRVALLCMVILAATGLAGPQGPPVEGTFKPLVTGKRGVVAAGHPLVGEAGLRMLEKGGTAVDAGVASLFAAAVVEPWGFTLGGECPILIKPKEGDVIALDGIGFSPRLATLEFYENLKEGDPGMPRGMSWRSGEIPGYGLLGAVVPGAVDAMLLALEQYGTMSFAEVVQPAIELAEGGYAVHPRLAAAFQNGRKVYEQWPANRKIYMPKGRPLEEGELFVQPDLARTLRELVEAEQQASAGGRVAGIGAVRDYFYRGPIARRISEFSKKEGGLLREEDFADFRARVEKPLATNYRGVEVYKVGFWSQGPVLLQNLNLLEGIDLKAMGHNSADYVHTVVEAMKLGYADRDAYYGDPDFSEIPKALITKEYADLRRPLINAERASGGQILGDPVKMMARAPEEFARARLPFPSAAPKDTTCVNVIDKDGIMFSATPSGGLIPAPVAGDTGIAINNRGESFVLVAGHPNLVAPRKRPRITLTPSIALKEGKPYLAFSAPGGDAQDQTLLQVFLNIVESWHESPAGR